jgi:hypothetical protein
MCFIGSISLLALASSYTKIFKNKILIFSKIRHKIIVISRFLPLSSKFLLNWAR